MSSILSMANSFFLNPEGLIAASALLPLLIFYLVKKQPEEQVMPSIMFFMKNRKSGKARTALRRLLRNLLLLFHILIVLGISAAIADPFIEAPANSERANVVLDVSASMSDELSEAKSFAKQNLGSDNTLLIAGENVDIPLESASRSRTSSRISEAETRETGTDIANALQQASRYPGPIVVASDLDQTVNSREAADVVEQLKDSGRTVRVYDSKSSNSWGIIDIESEEENISIDVKNFAESPRKIPVTRGNSTKEVSIGSNEVGTVEFSEKEGRNVFKLPEDGLKTDNTAYFSVPDQQDRKVTLISDRENPYLRKTFELIDFTDFEKLTPPIEQELNSDIYILGETDKLLSETVSEVESQVNEGSSVVVFGETGLENDMESLPVAKTGGSREVSVEIKKPRRIDIGNTEVIEVNRTRGEKLSSGSNALVQAEYGEGEILFYNIQDSDFNQDFLYPVFWKKMYRELLDQPSINELNIETGEELETEDGIETLTETGFYNSSGHLYAANLENEGESSENLYNPESGGSFEEGTENKNVQNLVAALLALLVIGEMIYLYRLGELKW